MVRYVVRAFALAGLCLYAAGMPLAQGDRAGDANERLSAGKEHIRAGRFDRAIEELRRALDLQRGLGDPPREAEMLIELGWAYSGAGRNPDALAGNERALALCRLAMQRRCEAAALTAAAHIHLRMGTLPAALEQFRQAL